MAGEQILIVGGDAKNPKLVRDLPQFHGYRTLEAATAAEGLALARAHAPHLILLDIQLPDLDGVAALGRLRAEPRTAALPVVALTAFAMAGDRERFEGAGFDGYVAKPLDVRAFPGQVRRYVTRGPAEGAPAAGTAGGEGGPEGGRGSGQGADDPGGGRYPGQHQAARRRPHPPRIPRG